MSVAKMAKLGVTYYDRQQADDGYTLFCTFGAKDVWLIDMEGAIVNRWRMPYEPGCHALLMPNGNLLYAAMVKDPMDMGLPVEFSGMGGLFMEVDWEGNLLWQAEVPYQNHDFQFMENRHVIFTSFHPSGTLSDELAKKVKGGQPGTEVQGRIYGDSVFEIDRKGETVWEWRASDHLDPELDVLCGLENRSVWPYLNTVWICKDGNILLSARYTGTVMKVEYPSGKVVARYGRGKLAHQHDSRELDNGNILLFDNGSHRHSYLPSYSRVIELDPHTDTIVWEYKSNPPCDFYSAICGGCERLSNGNTVICDSWIGRIFEVTPDGELVWEFISPFVGMKKGTGMINMMWRAHRYTRDYPGFEGKDLDPARFFWENQIYGPGASQ